MTTDDFSDLIDQAAKAVEADIAQKPVQSSDWIGRFDSLLERIFGRAAKSKEFWASVESIARAKNPSCETWTPYGIVASFATFKSAWATPGFKEARQSKLYGN